MAVVIIPAYQPDERLVAITDELWSHGCEIVVVDDGSGSAYQHIFEQISEVSIILHHEQNRGKGAALKTALTYIKNEMWDHSVIGVMDADGQHLTADMMRVLAEAEHQKKTLVIGVRHVGSGMPLRSKVGNWFAREIFYLTSGVHVSDTQTGMRAFDAELVPQLLTVEGERYEYETNVLLTVAREGITIAEVPIHTIYRDRKNSCSHFRSVVDSLRICKGIVKFAMSSISSFLLDYILFSVLMIFLPQTALPLLIANVLARMVSAFYNYSMNCRFVFHTQKRAGTAVRYFALAAWILLMNNLILETLVQQLHLWVYPAKLLTECVLFCMSFAVQNFMIFCNDSGQVEVEPRRP